MKKILLVAADGFSKTGVPSVFMNIVRNLSKEGYLFDIIYFDERFKYYYDEFCSFGGSAFLFDKQQKSLFFKKITRYISFGRYYKKTLKILKDNGPYDAIHCFNEYRSSPFLKAAKNVGVSLRIYHCNNIISIAGNFVNRFLMIKEKKQCLKYATTFIACSNEAIESAFGDKVSPIIINNPYDDQKFRFTDEAMFCREKLRLVQTSGFCDGKNQLFSLEIVSELSKKIDNVEMNFIGMDLNHKYRKMMDEKIAELKLSNKVVFHNFDVEQKPIFDICNYFLFPSKSEAFGIVLIEAQACGLKCFASDKTPAEVDVGGCVRLSLLKSASDWAEAIYSDFISTSEKRSYDCRPYQNNNILRKYINLYESGGSDK